jgi:hypothetical protein
MDNTTIVVTDVNAPLTIEAGGLSIYGNKTASLRLQTMKQILVFICIPTQQ